nr:hypothetical protein HAGR004_20260 [Bdellovibrio sp. HAGR004]
MNERKIGLLRFTKKDIRYYALVGILVALLMWTWGYVSLLNSDVFEFSRNYVTSNPKLIADLGEIKATRLGFSNFQRRYAAGIWTAKFNMVVEGADKSGTVYLSLKNAGNGWTVEDEKLEVSE